MGRIAPKLFIPALLVTGLIAVTWSCTRDSSPAPAGGVVPPPGPPPPAPAPPEEEDRPPIIIANGSVEIHSMLDQKDVGRGKWESDSATSYHQTHTSNNAPSQFTVTLIGSSTMGCSAPIKNVKSVKVIYLYTDSTPATFTVTPGTYVRIAFDKAPAPKGDDTLTLDSGVGGLQSVILDGKTTCSFAGNNPIIEIRPRK